jgi:hypothetical protein
MENGHGGILALAQGDRLRTVADKRSKCRVSLQLGSSDSFFEFNGKNGFVRFALARIEHQQLAGVGAQYDLGRGALVAILVGPFACFEPAFDVNSGAFSDTSRPRRGTVRRSGGS